jgi:transcriptional regulator with XRE-family HTH domain
MDKSIHSAQYALFLKTFKEVRRRKGLTQIDLAKMVGETQSFVSKCERGERRIDLIELRTFCNAMDVTLSEFVLQLQKALKNHART